MKRVTLDTNEYISALQYGGRAMRLLHMAVDGDIEIAISAPIISEVLRVLREKFDWQPYDLNDAAQRLRKIARLVAPTETLSVTHDEPDNRILECAKTAGSEGIVTEDKDLLRIGAFEGIKILNASDFLQAGRSR